MKNNILRLAIFTARFILISDAILAVLLIAIMILWQVDRSVFENWHMVSDGSIFKFTTNGESEGISLSNYGSSYFYFLCIKALIIAGILALIIQNSIRIIKSISSLTTFRQENVQSFRRMGALFLIWMILNILMIKESSGGLSLAFSVELSYVVWALICFVLAEIFSEGNKLMEDNKLTI